MLGFSVFAFKKSVYGENSQNRHGKGRGLGIFRLRVTPFGRPASAQDDRVKALWIGEKLKDFLLDLRSAFAYSTYDSQRERRRTGTGRPGNMADVGKPEKACNQKAAFSY